MPRVLHNSASLFLLSNVYWYVQIHSYGLCYHHDIIITVLLITISRYMARRCEFLEKFVGFNYNGGVGTGLENNSVLLGSTIVEVMINEVVNMSKNFDYQSDRNKIQQVSNNLHLHTT